MEEEVKNSPSEPLRGVNGWLVSEKKSFMESLGIDDYNKNFTGATVKVINDIKFSNDGKISVVCKDNLGESK